MSKVITGKVRFSYLHVFTPQAVNEGDKEKYSVSLIISKYDKDTIAKINKAIEEAKESGKLSKFKGKIPANLKTPLRDGDTEREDDEVYSGCYFINANSVNQPGLVDKDLQAIIDPKELYSGCYGRASINFYAYNWNGTKGIACGLNNLQKLSDGERLSGGPSAEEDFGGESHEYDDDLFG